MSEELATIEASKAQIKEMVDETSIGYHEKIYADITDGRVRFLAGTPGGTVVGFNDYVEGDIEDISGEARAIIKVPDLMDYLSLATDGTSSNVLLKFVGSDSESLCEQLKVSPADSRQSFEVGITLPASDSTMESVPTDAPALFDGDNVLVNQAEDRPVTTHIQTYTESLGNILDAVELREELDYYPLVVKDGEFLLEIGSEQGNYVNAELQGEVEGEDVDNLYGSGFEEVIKSLDGQVTLHVEDGKPLQVLKEKSYGTVRHVLGAAD
jgi:hypothetical protein